MAEDITSRFLNVISLFNGSVPLIAIQMQALKVGEHLTLHFTTVVDELTRGLVDEDEDAEAAPADRAYWEKKAARETVAIVDDLLKVAKAIEPGIELKYNKFYIGLNRQGQAFNFAIFRPRKNHCLLELRLPESEELGQRIESAGLETQEYDRRDGAYRLRLVAKDVTKNAETLRELMDLAFQQRVA